MNDHKYEGLKRNKSFNSGVDSSTCTRSRPKYFNYTWRFIAKFKTTTAAAIAAFTDIQSRKSFSKLFWSLVHLNRNNSHNFLSVFDRKTKKKPQTCHYALDDGAQTKFEIERKHVKTTIRTEKNTVLKTWIFFEMTYRTRFTQRG